MKTALITGATRGIGLAIAKRFCAAGYGVIATYSSDEEAAEHARTMLPDARFCRADASSEEEMRSLIEGLPAIDVLVCNAGIAHYAQIQDCSRRDWDGVLGVNAAGCFLAAKFAMKKMLGRGGAIVNIASVWGETGGSCESIYSASKGAVIAFTKALAKELAPSQITVNCVSPGVIRTRMNAHLTQEEEQALLQEIPLGRMGRAEEVADAVIFLAEQPYITGQVLGVNGGFLI